MATHCVQLKSELSARKGRIASLNWSPKEDRLAIFCESGTVHLWNPGEKQTHREDQGPAGITCASWSADGKLLACATVQGHLHVLDASTLEEEWEYKKNSGKPLLSCSWAPRGRHLAMGGHDCRVYVIDYRIPHREAPQIGIGHESPILGIAWAPDASTLVTATQHGVIGVWLEESIDNQLRHFLQWPDGWWFYGDPVVDLAWSPTLGRVASASRDGKICLWNVASRKLEGSFDTHERTFKVAFSPNGQFMVVRTIESVWFIRCDRMQDVLKTACPAGQRHGHLAIQPASGLVAADDCRNGVVQVWQVDFDCLRISSNLRTKKYSNAKVVLTGEPDCGKSSIARVLGTPASLSSTPGTTHRIYRIPEGLVQHSEDTSEIREILLWDLSASQVHDLAHRLYVKNASTVLFAFDATRGVPALMRAVEVYYATGMVSAPDLRWKPACAAFVATKIDRLERSDLADITEAFNQLGLPNASLLLTTTLNNQGLQELDAYIRASIQWSTVAHVDAAESFEDIQNFATLEKSRQGGLALSPADSLCALFERTFPAHRSPTLQSLFRQSMELLENLGVLYRFNWGDQVLLHPESFFGYAADLIAAAAQDPKGMGRLPLTEAESGRGHHFASRQKERLSDPSQERLLLAASVHELVHSGAAQKVSTHSDLYLVFPTQLSRELPFVPPDGQVMLRGRFSGSCPAIHSSLVVRLLSLRFMFSNPDLYKNAARLMSGSAGTCGVFFKRNSSPHGRNEVEVFFDDKADVAARSRFSEIVRDHISQNARPGTIEWISAEKDLTGPAMEPARTRVFFAYDHRDEDVRASVMNICLELEKRGIDAWVRARRMRPGDREETYTRARREHSTALVAVNRRSLCSQLQADIKDFKQRNCRIIPVIMPHSPATLDLPETLRSFVPANFRVPLGQEPYDQLALGIKELSHDNTSGSEDPPSPRPSPPRIRLKTAARKRIFLSYFHDDARLVEKLRDRLLNSGHPVWWDNDILPGTAWEEEIASAMRSSCAVLACCTGQSTERQESKFFREIREARDMSREMKAGTVFLIPVLLMPCDLPLELRDLQAIDCTSPNFDQGFQKLLAALRVACRNEPSR